MDIDISCPPELESVPVDLYSSVMPDDDDFDIGAFDIGVIEPELVSDVPPPKPMKEYKPRAKKDVIDDDREFLPAVMEVSERLKETVIGKLASVLHEKIEFPELSTFFSLLATASCSTSTAYATQYVTGSSVSLGMYVIVEQPPAMMKSYLLDVGMAPYRHAMSEHNKKISAKNREFKEREFDEHLHLKKGFSETSDGTSASIDGHLITCSEGRFVVSSAEQGGLISLFPENGSFSSNNDLLLKGYASEFISGMRAGRKSYSGVVQAAVILIAQPGSSRRVLAASNGSGLAERFFYMAEPDPIGFRRNEGKFPSRSELGPFESACKKCVDLYSNTIMDNAKKDLENMILRDPDNLVKVRASEEGYSILREARRANESYLYDLKVSGQMVMMGWLAKLETHALKIAANIHIIECLANNCKVSEVIPTWLIEESIDMVMMVSYHIKEIMDKEGESGSQAEEDAIIDILTGSPMERRALVLKAKNRKPFKAMPGGYKIAVARIDSMLKSGSLIVSAAGKVQIV